MNDLELKFVASARELGRLANDHAHRAGFYEEPSTFGDRLALMHSELSEALEGYRHGDKPSDHIPEFSSVEEELADTVIRILEYGHEAKYRIAEAVVAKMAFNLTRPYKHGGKRL